MQGEGGCSFVSATFMLWLGSGDGSSLHDSPQVPTSATALPALYVLVHIDSVQFALFLVLWVLLYRLAFCSEGDEVCGELHLDEMGTSLLRAEVKKPPISPLWD